MAVPLPLGRRHRLADSVSRSGPSPLSNASVSGTLARWPARLRLSRPSAESPATNHAVMRTGRVRRRAVRASPPSWLTSVCSGNSVTMSPTIHEYSDG